jgi:hypothetical protein
MTTVFLSGSRRISRLTDDITIRLDNMIEKELEIVTGDANGADKAMQSYLAIKGYRKVTIYYVGSAPRNNVGDWPVQHVEVDRKLKGREFYSQKDRTMSEVADFGLVVWDGRSSGSVQNMLWLIQNGKKLVLYFFPERQFHNICTEGELVDFLASRDDKVLDELGKKIMLPDRLRRGSRHQITMCL